MPRNAAVDSSDYYLSQVYRLASKQEVYAPPQAGVFKKQERDPKKLDISSCSTYGVFSYLYRCSCNIQCLLVEKYDLLNRFKHLTH